MVNNAAKKIEQKIETLVEMATEDVNKRMVLDSIATENKASFCERKVHQTITEVEQKLLTEVRSIEAKIDRFLEISNE